MCYLRIILFLTFFAATTASSFTEAERLEDSNDVQLQGLSENKEVFDGIRTKRGFALSEAEIKDQLQLAKVNGLKRRFKRFSCWHSCLGPFRKLQVKPRRVKDKSKKNVQLPQTNPKEEGNEQVMVDADLENNEVGGDPQQKGRSFKSQKGENKEVSKTTKTSSSSDQNNKLYEQIEEYKDDGIDHAASIRRKRLALTI